MPRRPATQPPTASTAPLAAQMQRDAAASREALESFGFSPESYDALIDRASQCQSRLADTDAPSAAARVASLTGVIAAALAAPASDLSARGRAYLALLESVLLQSLAAEAPSQRWINRLDRDCADLNAGVPGAPLALLTVAGMIADMGATVSPPPSGPIAVTWQGWRLGLVAAHAPDAASIPARITSGVESLKAARMPGLVVLDLAEAVCPEQRPLRASHPDAGAAELRGRLDRLLQDARPNILGSCDRDHAIGIVGAAFLSLHLVTANQVAFITAYRMMSLLDDTDPREVKLSQFRRAFGDL